MPWRAKKCPRKMPHHNFFQNPNTLKYIATDEGLYICTVVAFLLCFQYLGETKVWPFSVQEKLNIIFKMLAHFHFGHFSPKENHFPMQLDIFMCEIAHFSPSFQCVQPWLISQARKIWSINISFPEEINFDHTFPNLTTTHDLAVCMYIRYLLPEAWVYQA